MRMKKAKKKAATVAPPQPTPTPVSRRVHDELVAIDFAWGRIAAIAGEELARLSGN